MINNLWRQFRCQHSWHFCLSHLGNYGVLTAFGDYIIRAECIYCGKKVNSKKKIRKILREEGL